MSFHNNYQLWFHQSQEENCPYCLREEDPNYSTLIKEFKHSELYMHPNVALKGTCYLITKRHFVELFDMDEESLTGFMKEVQVAAKALKEVTGAVKINYEMHGNSAPHLHMHLFPRYMDDPFPGTSIDYNRTEPPVYEGDEFLRLTNVFADKLRNHQVL